MDIEKAAWAACNQANYSVFPEEKRREIFAAEKPYWTDVAKAVLESQEKQ